MELVSGNIYIRQFTFKKAGESSVGHTHNFDHTTYVPVGSLLIEELKSTGVDEHGNHIYETIQSVVKKAGENNWVLIKAETPHRLTAVEDNTTYHCIYSHRTPQGEIVQEFDGWDEALK